MTPKERQFEDLVPIELKLRLLRAEMDRLQSDARWIEQRCEEVQEEIDYYDELLGSRRRRTILRRVK